MPSVAAYADVGNGRLIGHEVAKLAEAQAKGKYDNALRIQAGTPLTDQLQPDVVVTFTPLLPPVSPKVVLLNESEKLHGTGAPF